LNKILDEMQQGEAAVKRLAEMDKSMGMQTKSEVIEKCVVHIIDRLSLGM